MSKKLFTVLLASAMLVLLKVTLVMAEESDERLAPEIVAAGWVYFVFPGPGSVHTVNYSNVEPVDLRVGTRDCCILDDVVEKYVDGCLIGTHRSVDGIRTQYDWISLHAGDHVIKLVNVSSTIHASGWYYELTTFEFTGNYNPCAPKEIIEPLFEGEYSCPDYFRRKDGDINRDGRLDWFYEAVSDDLTHTFELWGVDPTWRFFDEYFALIVNGEDLIGKCVFSGGHNINYMVHTGDSDNNDRVDRILKVVWKSTDESSDDVGTSIWPGFTSVEGKDSLEFEYSVAENELRVTHYDEQGNVIDSKVGPPAQPTHSWVWNSEPIAELQYEDGEFMTLYPAVAIEFDPDTLNLDAKGKWITVYIELPDGYDVAEIDASTILLNEQIAPVLDPKYEFVSLPEYYLVDHDDNGILERMVKFNKAEVQNILSPGPIPGNRTIMITGALLDETLFRGKDKIKAISSSR